MFKNTQALTFFLSYSSYQGHLRSVKTHVKTSVKTPTVEGEGARTIPHQSRKLAKPNWPDELDHVARIIPNKSNKLFKPNWPDEVDHVDHQRP